MGTTNCIQCVPGRTNGFNGSALKRRERTGEESEIENNLPDRDLTANNEANARKCEFRLLITSFVERFCTVMMAPLNIIMWLYLRFEMHLVVVYVVCK